MNFAVKTCTCTAHPQPAPQGSLLARGMPHLHPLLHSSSPGARSEAGAAAACTLPDVAGWQPLGLLLCGQWVKSCNCLQWRGIQDTSPVLVCKHIYLSAVVTSVIKRGKMERDKMSEEE